MKSKDCLLLVVVVILYSIYFSVPFEDKTSEEPEVIVKDTVEVVEHELLATYYNACEAQCDKDFLTTADNSNIDLNALEKLEIRWVALSRDMLEHYPYGTIIKVECDKEQYCGYWEVHDTMNKRFKERIDFLLPEGNTLGFTYPFECKITKIN